jgi:sulfur relay (sulfurtransferase) DsrC/TusE family protein
MELKEQILHLFEDDSAFSFEDVAISVFRYQAQHNPTYKAYLKALGFSADTITAVSQIPLAPISLFKKHIIKTTEWEATKRFLSSGTMGERSAHSIRDTDWYNKIAHKIIRQHDIAVADMHVVALLPSYLENGDSSLVHMVTYFAELSETPDPFYLYDHASLYSRIISFLKTSDKPILLLGVTFALVDFAQAYQIDDDRLRVCFTGGMKNRGMEMAQEEVMALLRSAFPSSYLFSEYGMTELQSQAYMDDSGFFKMSPTLKVLIKEVNDPLSDAKQGKTGMVGLIDLANVDTLSFILSEDLGRQVDAAHFEIQGRLSGSDLRGCNLLYRPA